jgi:hypothetical protein
MSAIDDGLQMRLVAALQQQQHLGCEARVEDVTPSQNGVVGATRARTEPTGWPSFHKSINQFISKYGKNLSAINSQLI